LPPSTSFHPPSPSAFLRGYPPTYKKCLGGRYRRIDDHRADHHGHLRFIKIFEALVFLERDLLADLVSPSDLEGEGFLGGELEEVLKVVVATWIAYGNVYRR
jgi:hypothetical protein